jgi:hypothetical protein
MIYLVEEASIHIFASVYSIVIYTIATDLIIVTFKKGLMVLKDL